MRMALVMRVALLVLAVAVPASGAEPPALARARALYNAGNFDDAVSQARAARKEPAYADAAALVLSRALLERYRTIGDLADLAAARETLGTVRLSTLSPRDQADLLIGLGVALYLDHSYGPAADMFDVALGRATVLAPADRLRLLDWWATAVDREAQVRSADRRAAAYERMVGVMEQELDAAPGSPVANYWLVVAARGQGEPERAWDAAIAAWIRAGLGPDTREQLRADLDRLVSQALIPERLRARPAREQQDATNALRAQWEQVKQQWK